MPDSAPENRGNFGFHPAGSRSVVQFDVLSGTSLLSPVDDHKIESMCDLQGTRSGKRRAFTLKPKRLLLLPKPATCSARI
jgi:hypothetical protein